MLAPANLCGELSDLALLFPDAPLFRSQEKDPDGGPGPITARQAERVVKAAAKKAGLKNAPAVSSHWLRHAPAGHAMDRGAKIHLVQATLEHSDISTTGRYLHARRVLGPLPGLLNCAPPPPDRSARGADRSGRGGTRNGPFISPERRVASSMRI